MKRIIEVVDYSYKQQENSYQRRIWSTSPPCSCMFMSYLALFYVRLWIFVTKL